ncbi:protein translocase subunit SecD [Streptomyces sp. NPDC127178]|uniref:protein translocase subunit SecD n=1 Tax=unclassified Streptomyces TaxID=2593676 RepID=UPI00362C93CE
MFASGTTAPRLGIDLAGGTSIILEAKNEPGKPNAINETNMNTAVGIIERRVNGLGVSEAEVQTQGDSQIVVNIPKGTNAQQAREQVGTTAQLYFRPVLQASSSPPPSNQPHALPTAPQPPGQTPGPGGGLADLAPLLHAHQTAAEPSPPPPPPPPPDTPQPSAELRRQFTALNCADARQRERIGQNSPPDSAVAACGRTPAGTWEKYLLGPAGATGQDISDASATLNQSGAWVVQMDFTGAGSEKLQQITGKLSQQPPPMNQFAIVLDGEVVSAPQVNQTLSASAEISGSFDQQSAKDLANILSYGALPLSFETQSVTTVTAALGAEQLQAGLIAGAIGLALVVIYLVVYYRGLSLVALLGLLVSAILTYTLMSLLGPAIGFALNLPAVCGAIVAIGITADSFIVYFERIRDEIREGRTLRPAVERAWPRARRTILVSDFVSFLAAAVLFIVTVGKVQGFAFTLGLTTLLDVVVVFFFTKPLMTLLARKKFFASGHPWSGLDPKRLGAKPPLRRSRGTPAPDSGEA